MLRVHVSTEERLTGAIISVRVVLGPVRSSTNFRTRTPTDLRVVKRRDRQLPFPRVLPGFTVTKVVNVPSVIVVGRFRKWKVLLERVVVSNERLRQRHFLIFVNRYLRELFLMGAVVKINEVLTVCSRNGHLVLTW